MSTKIKLYVQGLSSSQAQSGAYALILAEEDGERRIPVIVGISEAQSIAIALEHISPPRPLTHDLFVAFGEAVGVRLKEVFVRLFEDGIYYSELVYEKDGDEIRLDSRTSDAIGIALRSDCSIYTTEQVIRECGMIIPAGSDAEDEESAEEYLLDLEPEDIKDDEQLKKWLSLLQSDELEDRLKDAVADENYEFAKMYKDEMQRREKRI